MPYVQNPSDWSQVQKELAIEQAQLQAGAVGCPCPRWVAPDARAGK